MSDAFCSTLVPLWTLNGAINTVEPVGADALAILTTVPRLLLSHIAIIGAVIDAFSCAAIIRSPPLITNTG